MKANSLLIIFCILILFSCKNSDHNSHSSLRSFEYSSDSVPFKTDSQDSIFNSEGIHMVTGKWIKPSEEIVRLDPIKLKPKRVSRQSVLLDYTGVGFFPVEWREKKVNREQLRKIRFANGTKDFQLKNSTNKNVVTGRAIAFKPRKIRVDVTGQKGVRVQSGNAQEMFSQLNTEGGYELNNTWAIDQDSLGSVWLGTRGDGLLRFDGNFFDHWDRGKGLPNNTIRSVEVDKKGRVWMATWGQGICMKDGNEFFQFSEEDGLSCNLITKIFIDSKDRIWFGTENSGVGCIDNDNLMHFCEREGLLENTILDIEESSDGEVFFATFGAHLCSWDGSYFYYWDEKAGIEQDKIWCLEKGNSGAILIGTWEGQLYSWQDEKIEKLVVNGGGAPLGPIMSIEGEERGDLWIATYGNGIVHINNRGLEFIDSKKGLKNEKVMDLMLDRNHRLWICTAGGGLQVYNNSSYNKLTFPTSWQGNPLNTLFFNTKNDMWLANSKNGLGYARKEEYLDVSSAWDVGNNVYDLIEAKNGSMCIATDGKGLFIIDEKKGFKYNREIGLPSNVITAIFEDCRQRLWMAFDNNKVAYLLNNELHVFSEYSSESRSAIKAFAEDDNGNIYWSVDDLGLVECKFLYGNPQLMIYANPEGLHARTFFDLSYFEGKIWLCTESGIIAKCDREWVCLKKSFNRTIGQAFSFQEWKNRLMVWTEGGLIGIKFKKANQLRPHNSRNFSFEECSLERSQSFDNENLPISRDAKLAVDMDTNLYVTSGGVAIKIDESNWTSKYPMHQPRIELTHVNHLVFQANQQIGKNGNLGSEFNSIEGENSFAYSQNNLQFSFSTGAESVVSNDLFIYRLVGAQTEWSVPSKDRKIEFLSLPSGRYELQIAVVSPSGDISSIASFYFAIEPPFWFSNWAIGVYILLTLAGIWIFVKWRTLKLRQDQQKLQMRVDEATEEILSQKKRAEEQRERIEESQRLILESIEYAKRIQTAILPARKIVESFLPESFIVYLPKDIVAGDFYWMESYFHHNQQWISFAVADCTGHGVPGALMSVLCHNGLNRSVKEHGLIFPNEILNKTREIVINELGDDENAINDGMDISLCTLNNGVLYWSGANRPLWIIRQGEIIEIKGDKQPVGRFQQSRSFTQHEFLLIKGDLVFIFTDGFTDQFGGEQGKKLKSSFLKQRLIEASDKNCDEISKELEDLFYSWKGDQEQVDDVCLMGFKF